MISEPDSNSRHPLLEEVLPTAGDLMGPHASDVLKMVRDERMRRRRPRLIIPAAVVAFAGTWLFLRSAAKPEISQVAAPVPPPIIIREVDDHQFLALLQDTPAALLEWPNGERTLLLVED